MLAVVAVLAALLGGRVQRWVVSVLVLRSDAPSSAAIAAIAEAEGYSTAGAWPDLAVRGHFVTVVCNGLPEPLSDTSASNARRSSAANS